MTIAKEVLAIEMVINDSTRGMSKHEISKLVESHALISKARDDFLNGLLQWWEYLELCEAHELNIDSYLDGLDKNLEDVGIIV